MSRMHLCIWKQSSACSLCKESLSDHADLQHISCSNTSPRDLVLTHSMLESWGGWNKMMPGAQSEREVEPLGSAGGSWNSRTGWSVTHSKRPNQLQVSGSCKGWQKASPCLKPALLLVPWGLQQRFQMNKEISGKETHTSFFLFTTDILLSSAWNHLPHTTTNIEAGEQFFYHPHEIRRR